jgi:hypothetical protein
MTPKLEADRVTFGYISTWDSQQHGCLGGYLIVCEFGRPLEFHCTAPLRLSRAQHILYGATLWPYVFGERIAHALLQSAKLRPSLLITDEPAVLVLRPQLGIPMVRLIRTAGANGETPDRGASALPATRENVVLSDTAIELPRGCESDREPVLRLLGRLSEAVELMEPFERIAAAIREAQRIDDNDGQSDARAA